MNRLDAEPASRQRGISMNLQVLPRFFLLLGGITCFHFLLITALSLLHLYSYKADIDVQQFNQLFWSLLHTGKPFTALPAYTQKVNWFGAVHFSPIFYLLLPAYAVWPSTFTLQLLHCAFLSGTAVPVALALRRLKLADKTILALVVMMLFNPFYFDAGLWEFHEISIGCFLVATTFWALLARNRRAFLLCVFLLILTRENFGLTAAGFGFLWWWRYRDGIFGWVVAGLGIVVFVLVLEVVMPGLNGGLVHPMLRAAAPRYTWLKGDMKNIFYNFIYLFFADSPYNTSGIVYLGVLFFTVCFFPLLSLFYLAPALADFAVILLSSDEFPRSLAAYHSAVLIPVLTIASGITIARYPKLSSLPLWLLLPVFIVIANGLLFYKNGITAYELKEPAPLANFDIADKVKSMIGSTNVTAQPSVAFLLSSGPAQIFPFPENLSKSEFIVLYLRHPYRFVQYRVFGDVYFLATGYHYDAVLDVLNGSGWGIVMWEDNWLVLKRNAPDQLPEREQIIEQIRTMLSKPVTAEDLKTVWTPVLP